MVRGVIGGHRKAAQQRLALRHGQRRQMRLAHARAVQRPAAAQRRARAVGVGAFGLLDDDHLGAHRRPEVDGLAGEVAQPAHLGHGQHRQVRHGPNRLGVFQELEAGKVALAGRLHAHHAALLQRVDDAVDRAARQAELVGQRLGAVTSGFGGDEVDEVQRLDDEARSRRRGPSRAP